MKVVRRMIVGDLDSLGQEEREEGRGKDHKKTVCLDWILLTQNKD